MKYEIEKRRYDKTIDQAFEFLKYYIKKIAKETKLTEVEDLWESFLKDDSEYRHRDGSRYYEKKCDGSIYYEQEVYWSTGKMRINIILQNQGALVYDVYLHFLYVETED